jgi:hypothetical protein
MNDLGVWGRTLRLSVLFFFACCVGATCLQGTPLQQTFPQTPDNDCTSGVGAPTNGVCPSGTLRVCIDRCVPVVGAGQPCTNDLCNATGNVCDVGLTCLGKVAKDNRCVKAVDVGAACSLSKTAFQNLCPAGTYCRDHATCASRAGLSLPNAQPGCAHFVSEGSRCDGDFETAENGAVPTAICDACEPGTTCAPLAGTQVSTCQRACNPATPGSSCPCATQACQAASGSANAHCVACLNNNEGSCAAGQPCCDSMSACAASGSSLFCCHPIGASCTSARDCCEKPNSTPACREGRCSYACSGNYGDCDGNPATGCETVVNTVDHCGSCVGTCSAPLHGYAGCANGTCQGRCVGPLLLCGAQCVDPDGDAKNCGGCNKACAAGATCQHGLCVSPQAPAKCGTCATGCCAGTICNYGSCVPCAAHQAACTTTEPCCGAPQGDVCLGSLQTTGLVCDVPDGPECNCNTNEPYCPSYPQCVPASAAAPGGESMPRPQPAASARPAKALAAPTPPGKH